MAITGLSSMQPSDKDPEDNMRIALRLLDDIRRSYGDANIRMQQLNTRLKALVNRCKQKREGGLRRCN